MSDLERYHYHGFSPIINKQCYSQPTRTPHPPPPKKNHLFTPSEANKPKLSTADRREGWADDQGYLENVHEMV